MRSVQNLQSRDVPRIKISVSGGGHQASPSVGDYDTAVIMDKIKFKKAVKAQIKSKQSVESKEKKVVKEEKVSPRLQVNKMIEE